MELNLIEREIERRQAELKGLMRALEIIRGMGPMVITGADDHDIASGQAVAVAMPKGKGNGNGSAGLPRKAAKVVKGTPRKLDDSELIAAGITPKRPRQAGVGKAVMEAIAASEGGLNLNAIVQYTSAKKGSVIAALRKLEEDGKIAKGADKLFRPATASDGYGYTPEPKMPDGATEDCVA